MAETASEASQQIDQIKTFVVENGSEFVLKLITAFLIFYIGKKVAGALTGLSKKAMIKGKVDEALVSFLAALINIGLMLIVIMAALGQLGVNMMGFGAILAAAGLAIGLSLQGTLSNFASGVMIILFKPFKIGDFVSVAGETGVIEEIHIFNTMMKTGDNVQIIIPNGSVVGGNITNFSAKETRRIDLVVGCGYDDDLKAVKAHLTEMVTKHELILQDPAPVVAVHELGDSCINLVVRPWVKSSDYWAVRWELTENIKTSFDEKGFSIPYPQTDVHVHRVES
jgi:small conductance mechanosensitive channel